MKVHMPLRTLIALVDEARWPDGRISDRRGDFVRVEIQRWRQGLPDPLQFLPAEASGAAELNPLIRMAKDYYFAAPDYAVVAYKA